MIVSISKRLDGTMVAVSGKQVIKDFSREQAQSRLLKTGYLALREVALDLVDGQLTLRGSVPSYFLKQVAQSAVIGTSGVHTVVNEIVVA
jgi:osmotically-inducible protein OsmY